MYIEAQEYFRAFSHDGTKQNFDYLSEAVQWAQHHLQDWKQKGDKIRKVTISPAATCVEVLDSVGERTDASVTIIKRGADPVTDAAFPN